MSFNEYEPMRFRVKLLKVKRTIQKVFPKNSIQSVVSTPAGVLHITGYPSVTLVDGDWEPIFDREDLIRV